MTSAAAALPTRQAWLLAIVATLTMAVSYADRQALAILAPTVCKALAISDQQFGWLISSFSIAYLVGTPLAGRWIDALGARRGLTWAVLAWTVVAALHALVPSLGVLFALRIGLGLTESPSFPGAAQAVHRVLPEHDRPRGFGLLFLGSSFGAMVVPPLATRLEHTLGYRFAFLGTALVGLAWLPLWLSVTRGAPVRAVLDTDVTAPPPPPLGELLRHPAAQRGLLVILGAAPLMGYALNWSAKLLVAELHSTQLEIGSVLWIAPVIYDVGTFGFGHLLSRRMRRLGKGSPPPLLLVVLAASLGAALLALPLASTPWLVAVLVGVAMAGGGGLYALSTADTLSRVPASAVAATSGLLAAAQSVAYIIANPLIGHGVSTIGHLGVARYLVIWLAPGCIAWLLWRPPPRV